VRNRYQLYQQTKDSPQEEHTFSGDEAPEAGVDVEAKAIGGDSSFVVVNSQSEGLSSEDLTPPVAKEVRSNHNNHIGNNYLKKNVPAWVSFERRSLTTKVEPYDAVMGGCCSCVTVECVTNTWVEGEWLGSTDEERRVRLNRDTCPGFISEGDMDERGIP